MPTTQIRGETQIMDNSIDLTRLFDPFLSITTGDWDVTGGVNAHTITGIRDPIADDDAATKKYVDDLVGGVAWKDPVRACSPTNLDITTDLQNGDVVDGVTLATGDRVLLTGQTNAAADEVQTIDISGTPTGGTWELQLQLSGYAQINVSGLAHNITAAALETAIDGACTGVVSGWTNGDISVSGTDILNTLTLTYDGTSVDELNHEVPTADISGLTGGTPAFNAATSVEGNEGGSENGVYEVVASGTANRAPDWPAGDDAHNWAVFVQTGTTCGDRAYVVTNDQPNAIIDSNELTFIQFAGSGLTPNFVFNDYVAGTNGSPTVVLSNTNILTNTERIYLNGVRQRRGGSDDYTIVYATGTLTFTFNLKNTPGKQDVVYADYHL